MPPEKWKNASVDPFMQNVFSHPYQFDESDFQFKGCWVLFQKKLLLVNSREPGQKPRFAASDLVLHCLPMFHKKGC